MSGNRRPSRSKRSNHREIAALSEHIAGIEGIVRAILAKVAENSEIGEHERDTLIKAAMRLRAGNVVAKAAIADLEEVQ